MKINNNFELSNDEGDWLAKWIFRLILIQIATATLYFLGIVNLITALLPIIIIFAFPIFIGILFVIAILIFLTGEIFQSINRRG